MHTPPASCRFRATPVLLRSALILFLAAIFWDLALSDLACAQSPSPPSPPPVQSAPSTDLPVLTGQPESDPTRPPPITSVMPIFDLISSAVRSGKPLSDQLPSDFALMEHLRTIQGCHVQLRLDGRLIGKGSTLSITRLTTAQDCYNLVKTACNQALTEALKALNLPNDALREDNFRIVSKQFLISVECAALPVPLAAKTWNDVTAELSPGLHGLAVQVTDSAPNSLFPSHMLALNTLPSLGLSGLIAQSLGEGGAAAALEEPLILSQKHNLRIYRFLATHAAQSQPDQPPSALVRGSRVIYAQAFPISEIRQFTQAMAAHLLARFKTADAASMLGSLRPWLDQPDLPSASVAEESLAILALAQFVKTPGLEDKIKIQFVSSTCKLFSNVCSRLNREDHAFDDDADAAMFILAHHAILDLQPQIETSNPAIPKLASAAVERVQSAFVLDKGFREDVLHPVRSPIALALVQIAQHSKLDADHKLAEQAVRKVFAQTPRAQLVTHMPWLAQAEIELAALNNQTDLPAAVALREMRDQLWQHQLQLSDAGIDNTDFIGGIVFTSSQTSPLPSWQSARPLAFAAMSLRDTRLTTPGNEALLQLAKVLPGIRFLRQLQIDRHACWNVSNPKLCIGAVRSSNWDQTLPPDATSFSLIACTQLLISADALDADGSKRATKPPQNSGQNQP